LQGIKFWGVFFSEDAFWKPAAPRTDGHNEPYNMLSSFRRRWWGDNNFAAEADAVLHDSSPSSTRSSNIGIIGQNRPSSVDLMSNSSFRGRRSHDYDLSPLGGQRRENKNTVSVEKIRAGLDVRTTIMLRNIPNRIDQAMLKSIVDQTSHGKYDFMYLRIGKQTYRTCCEVYIANQPQTLRTTASMLLVLLRYQDALTDYLTKRWLCVHQFPACECSFAHSISVWNVTNQHIAGRNCPRMSLTSELLFAKSNR